MNSHVNFVKKTATVKFLAKHGKTIEEEQKVAKIENVNKHTSSKLRGVGYTSKSHAKSNKQIKAAKQSRKKNRR